MIGHLFHTRKSSAAGPAGLDSATEESHTRHLLYPDSSTLCHPDGQPYPLHGAPLTPGSGHDGPLPEIDLEYPRDCRIIIAQDETPAMPKTILFDSKPTPPRAEPPPPPNPRTRPCGSDGNDAVTGLHARRASLTAEPATPRSPTIGSFARLRRGSSISSMPNIDEHTPAHAQAQARAKESTDLANICLDCMFGNLAMNYRGNSNKIHIVPLDAKPSDLSMLSTSVQDGTSSLGRAEGMRRRSNLAKSFTPANFSTDVPRTETSEGVLKEPKRRTIFITRMFSVTIPDDPCDGAATTLQASLSKTAGFPLPQSNTKPGISGRPHYTPIRKSPMYAITIILHLPISHTSIALRPTSRGAHQRNLSHFSSSAPGHDSIATSLDSDRKAGWAFMDSNLGIESLLSSSLSSDVDDRVDVVGQHWDVIMRALTSLQYIVQERILAQFNSPDSVPIPIQSQHRQQLSRGSNRDTPLQPLRKTLRLQPNALMKDKEVKLAAEYTGNRVVSGMRIPRVMTGQGKWGVWREEARWLGRWAGRREQNFFFFNLLTAFLGNHTEWLNVLGPKWHRKRHREQQRASTGENLTLTNRTVIVSPDKMAARRLVFLLAAFLPPNAPAVGEHAPFMRPSTSASLRDYSPSPPTNMPPSRKHSLRRQINRRPKGKQSMTHLRLHLVSSQGGHHGLPDAATDRNELGPTDLSDHAQESSHSRRSSIHSIRTTLVITSMSEGTAAARNNTSVISAAPSQDTVPIAHFTLPRTRSSGALPDQRPDSSDSLASANLINTLHRTGTGQTIASNESSNASRWSGFMNFWGGRRSSSTDHSDFLQTTDDGIGFRGQERPRSQPESMVQELSMDQVFDNDTDNPPLAQSGGDEKGTMDAYSIGGSSGVPASAARPIPERPKAFDVPLKLSVNEKDGVIDVDISLPDFGSPLQSPLLGGYGSVSSQHGSSYGESSTWSAPYCEPEQSVNAAGWLGQFHPDFAVQAIKPYRELERDMKRAMSAEPTPLGSVATASVESGPIERWVHVCSALIADAGTFTIKRISLRRLVRLIPTPTHQPTAMTPSMSGMLPGRSQYGNPYTAGASAPMLSEVHLAETFDLETIMDFDAALIDGVDRVLAQSGENTRLNSARSSRSSSRRGRRDSRADSDAVPYADCKSVIFDVLDSIVKDVTAERNVRDEPKLDDDQKSTRTAQARTATDSSLKEGIRRWLSEVE